MTWTVRRADLRQPGDRAALLHLLDQYAQDPMGGGTALPSEVRARLCDDLARLPGAVSFLAWRGQTPIGLLNALTGYSTFKAQPLLNVHDIAVDPDHRRQGVGQALLGAAERHARDTGCCKLTLEVLSGNTHAQRSYQRFGFMPYELDPSVGQAVLLQKWLTPD